MAAAILSAAVTVRAIGFDAEAAYESVFVIYSGTALGSGFAVGENCIVTNAHVIDDPRRITVVTYGEEEYAAAVLGMDEAADIAVLLVADAAFPYLEIADLSEIRTGDDIYAIGAPKGMAYTLTKGGISAKERVIGGRSYIQIDAPINEGNSGGPLLTDSGRLLGMNTLKMTDSEGIGLAIPIDRICTYLGELGMMPGERADLPEAETTDGPDAPSAPILPEPEGSPEREDPAVTVIAAAAVIVAALSLSLNVVLAVSLAHEKKKCADPRERTDFEIEFLE